MEDYLKEYYHYLTKKSSSYCKFIHFLIAFTIKIYLEIQ